MAKNKDWNRRSACKLDLKVPLPGVLDCIIIGAGPAGMTAAVYTTRRKLSTLVLCGRVGGQMMSCADIQNWTGVIRSTGPDLVRSFYAHLQTMDAKNREFDLWLSEDTFVENIKKEGKNYRIQTKDGDSYLCRTIIIATGKHPRMLGIPGEKEALGKGVTFSATSDAPLFKGKKVMVVGGGNSAMGVCLQLVKYTDDVTLVTNLDHLIGEGCLMDKINADDRIQVKYKVETKEVHLDPHGWVQGVTIEENGNTEHIDCAGVFIGIGQTPSTDWIGDFLELNDQNEIPIDGSCHTAVPGVYAAGDVTSETHKQVVVAAGHGAIAALEAHKYILEN